MPLLQLIYMSSLVTTEQTLVDAIVETSVRNNQHNKITGMLLHSEGNVVQVLEGEKQSVIDTFHRIENDIRHLGIIVLIDEEIAHKDFGTWSMGCKHINGISFLDQPGDARLLNLRNSEVASRVRPSKALDVLRSFAI
jgi:hypothetical protein